MDGVEQRGEAPSDTERSRRDRALLGLVASCTPRGYWLGLRSGIRRAYKETLESNQNNPNLLQQSIEFATIYDRHFYVDKLLHDVSLEFGFPCVPALISINKWRYAQTDLGPFTSIQKYCWTRADLPRPAKFRKDLARSGGISVQDDLLRPRLLSSDQVGTLNGILIHGPLSRNPRSVDFGEVGFICYAIPYDDYSDWAAIFDIDKLIAECEIQGSGAVDGGGPRNDGPMPTWRNRPERLE